MGKVRKAGFADKGRAGLFFLVREDLSSEVPVQRLGIGKIDGKSRKGNKTDSFEVFRTPFGLNRGPRTQGTLGMNIAGNIRKLYAH